MFSFHENIVKNMRLKHLMYLQIPPCKKEIPCKASSKTIQGIVALLPSRLWATRKRFTSPTML